LKNPQDILKAVHSMQEEKAKQIEELCSKEIKSKFESEFNAEIQEINGIILKQSRFESGRSKDLVYELTREATTVNPSFRRKQKTKLTCYVQRISRREKQQF
jgi:alanyl-tRNA synthetase